ncbi:hypothetical protein GOODEAATRI_013845 [Goodea atripinnis]|uniref:Neurobeachin n=1 Tax=Goodea atripinnis TaxID=208336 RepID=A0ABV0P441_9TELE
MTSEKPVTIPGSLSLSDRQPPPSHRQRGAAVPDAATGKPMMLSGSGSVVLPAGMIDPAVPIRNIKMKFAVLIGLIQVGEVSNRDIVETVLNLVSTLHRALQSVCNSWPLLVSTLEINYNLF